MKVTPGSGGPLPANSTSPTRRKTEVAGNGSTIDSRPLQTTVEELPVEDGSYWHYHDKELHLIGKDMFDGMVGMLKGGR